MATIPQNEIARSAQRRWPGYTISGTGTIAVVYHCTHRIELVMTPLEANTLITGRCGPHCLHVTAPDGGFHAVERIQLPTAARVIVPTVWERDRQR